MKTERRSVLKKLFASVVGVTGLGVVANAKGIESSPEKVVGNVTSVQNVPMFSGHVIHNGLVYIAGKGAHTAPFEIKAHTEIVLKELEKELIKEDYLIEKILKKNIYINNIINYKRN